MKVKINTEIPTLEKLLAGLDARVLHTAWPRAEEAVVKAEHTLEQRRRELAELERTVATLPARIHRGEVKASELTDTMRRRDAAALLVEPAADALKTARERVPAEEKAARLALEKEVDRRAATLVQVAGEISPILDELRGMSLALSRVLHPQSMGMSAVDWTCCLNCDVGQHIRIMQQATASVPK